MSAHSLSRRRPSPLLRARRLLGAPPALRASHLLGVVALLSACAGDVTLDLDAEGGLRDRSYVNARSADDADAPPFSGGGDGG